jgi:hypothetical protein
MLEPGSGILYMKVGTHARETLEDIIVRKTKEIEDAGYAMWGYGGNTCHPETMVQPFAKTYMQSGSVIHLCMEKMTSSHFAEQIRADEFSPDGTKWEKIPKPINVLGSRYALVIKNLREEEFALPLAATRVAIGPSMGRSGLKYISGRVDKACLEIIGGESDAAEDKIVKINLVAELASPFAVYLKNTA